MCEGLMVGKGRCLWGTEESDWSSETQGSTCKMGRRHGQRPGCIDLVRLLRSLVSSGGFPVGSDGKESACSGGDQSSIPGSGRSPGEGNDNPLQCSYLENPRMEEPGRLQSMGSQRVGHD